jgi:hypothetical protein
MSNQTCDMRIETNFRYKNANLMKGFMDFSDTLILFAMTVD